MQVSGSLVRSRSLRWLPAAVAAAALAAPAGARAAACPGADACPYGGVAVVGEDGHGVFRLAQALALSPDGQRVYVGDSGSYRIQAFTRDGVFLRQWAIYGTGPGEIKGIGGIATDSAGRVYVLDSSNDRVEVFDPDGRFLGMWGSSGTAPGQFDLGSNGGIAIDGAYAYVADQDNGRIQRLTLDPATGMADTDPAHVLTWATFGACPAACTLLNLNHPQGVAVSTVAGQPHDVFVADDDNHRVVKYSADGTPEGAIDAAGELGYPYDVGVDGTHALYVVDDCDPSFVPVCTYTTGDRTDLTHQRVRKYDASSLAFLGTWGVFGDQPGQFEFPRAAAAVSADPAGGVYVADAANNRVQSFDASGKFLRKWGISGRGASYLTRPAAVASDADGNFYVADTGSSRVQEFDAGGSYLGEWSRLGTTGYPASGTGLGEFNGPAGLAIAPDGTVYVADTGNNRLQARDPVTGAWRVVGGVTLRNPRGVALDGAGHLYVADTNANVVRVLELATGTWSAVDHPFTAPRGVAVDAEGNLYVTNTNADRVEVRDALTGQWRTIGAGQLSRPSGIALQGDALVVADTNHDRLVRFGADGTLESAWGARGADAGEFDGPQGVAVDGDGRILAADEFNNRVQIFSPAEAPPPPPPPTAQPTTPTVAPGPTPAPAVAAAEAPALRLNVLTAGRPPGHVRVQLACSHTCLAGVRLLAALNGRTVTLASRELRLTGTQSRHLRLRVRPELALRAAGASVRLVVRAIDGAGVRAREERPMS
jgi:DNA-binding beta-propeller fold protein YncE